MLSLADNDMPVLLGTFAWPIAGTVEFALRDTFDLSDENPFAAAVVTAAPSSIVFTLSRPHCHAHAHAPSPPNTVA